MTELTIAARDGYALPASLFEAERPRAVVIVSPATATPRGYYANFCTYLASLGATAVTYDYRGTFEPPAVLRRSPARMREWGTLDFPGVIDWCAQRYDALPLYAVGHSVGGHVLAQAPNNARVERAVHVAAQSGYWRLYRGFEKYRVYAFMSAVMPLLTRLYGYFPGKRFIFGTNLARGVLDEWSRWCTRPGYFLDDPSMREVRAPGRSWRGALTTIGLADDPWATPAAIAALEPAFPAATLERLQIDPAALGCGPVGHMGFFRSAHRLTLWPLAARALGLTEEGRIDDGTAYSRTHV